MAGLFALIVDSELPRWEVSKIHMLFILIATHCMSVICGKVRKLQYAGQLIACEYFL